MKKRLTAKDFENQPITRGDIDAGRLIPRARGPNGAVSPAKLRVNIYLDSAVVEHFKAQAGARGYQTLINESLKDAIRSERIEDAVRRAVREELAPLRRASAQSEAPPSKHLASIRRAAPKAKGRTSPV